MTQRQLPPLSGLPGLLPAPLFPRASVGGCLVPLSLGQRHKGPRIRLRVAARLSPGPRREAFRGDGAAPASSLSGKGQNCSGVAPGEPPSLGQAFWPTGGWLGPEVDGLSRAVLRSPSELRPPRGFLTCSSVICFHQGLSTATKDTYDALHMQTLPPR